MSGERKETREAFLSRWSRLKKEQPPENAVPAAQVSVPAESEAPQLPKIEELTLDSDFRGFFHPKVDENVRRAALRKLFSDPHFNVMDGLDVYIEDYTISEPIPAAMLAGLNQAKRILHWAEGKDDEESEESEASAEEKSLAQADARALPAAPETKPE